jgi:hypothetical protein
MRRPSAKFLAAPLVWAPGEWRRLAVPKRRLPRLLLNVQTLSIETIPLIVWLSANKRYTAAADRTDGSAVSADRPDQLETMS